MGSKDIKDVHKGGKDFTKVKRKVGKKALDNANVTQTNIQSKTINVPLQDLEVSSDPTNSRNMTLVDLQQQAVHYNGNVRAEAYRGMSDLFQLHPFMFTSNISHLIVRFGEAMIDNEPSVRRSVCSLLFQHLHTISPTNQTPFLHILFRYLSAATSHVDASVRIDSVHFIRLILTLYPREFKLYCQELQPNFSQLQKDRTHALNTVVQGNNEGLMNNLPNMSVTMNKIQRDNNSGKRNMVKQLGASGLFAQNKNAIYSNQQSSYDTEVIDGIGKALLQGTANGTLGQNAGHDTNLVLLCGLEDQNDIIRNILQTPDSVNTPLLNTAFHTLSTAQTTLTIIDNVLKLFTPQKELEELHHLLQFYTLSNTEVGEKDGNGTSTEHVYNNPLFALFTNNTKNIHESSIHNKSKSTLQQHQEELCDVLFACWSEYVPNEYKETEVDEFSTMDMLASVDKHLISRKSRMQDDPNKDTVVSESSKKDKKANKMKLQSNYSSKLHSHGLAVMQLISSCLLNIAKIEQEENQNAKLPLAKYYKKMYSTLFLGFPYISQSVHDLKIIAELNLNVAQLITLYLRCTTLTKEPEVQKQELLLEQGVAYKQELMLCEKERDHLKITCLNHHGEYTAEFKEMRAEESEMRKLGYKAGNSHTKVTQLKKSRLELYKQVKERYITLARRDSTQLHDTYHTKYVAYVSEYDKIRVLEHKILTFLHECVSHHCRLSAKTVSKLQTRITRQLTNADASNMEDQNNTMDDGEESKVDHPSETPSMVGPMPSSHSTNDAEYNVTVPLSDLILLIWKTLPYLQPHLQTWLLESSTNLLLQLPTMPLSVHKVMFVPLLLALLHPTKNIQTYLSYGFVTEAWIPTLLHIVEALFLKIPAEHSSALRRKALLPVHSIYSSKTLQHMNIPLLITCIMKSVCKLQQYLPSPQNLLHSVNQARTDTPHTWRSIFQATKLSEGQYYTQTNVLLRKYSNPTGQVITSQFDYNTQNIADKNTMNFTNYQSLFGLMCMQLYENDGTANMETFPTYYHAVRGNTLSNYICQLGPLACAPQQVIEECLFYISHCTMLSIDIMYILATLVKYNGCHEKEEMPVALSMVLKSKIIDILVSNTSYMDAKEVLQVLLYILVPQQQHMSAYRDISSTHLVTLHCDTTLVSKIVQNIVNLDVSTLYYVHMRQTSVVDAMDTVDNIPSISNKLRQQLLLDVLLPSITTTLKETRDIACVSNILELVCLLIHLAPHNILQENKTFALALPILTQTIAVVYPSLYEHASLDKLTNETNFQVSNSLQVSTFYLTMYLEEFFPSLVKTWIHMIAETMNTVEQGIKSKLPSISKDTHNHTVSNVLHALLSFTKVSSFMHVYMETLSSKLISTVLSENNSVRNQFQALYMQLLTWSNLVSTYNGELLVQVPSAQV